MVYRKPWSFRLGVVAFASIAFLAATGRSIGWDAAPGPQRPATAEPVVLSATVTNTTVVEP